MANFGDVVDSNFVYSQTQLDTRVYGESKIFLVILPLFIMLEMWFIFLMFLEKRLRCKPLA